jgi:hypothetical protein
MASISSHWLNRTNDALRKATQLYFLCSCVYVRLADHKQSEVSSDRSIPMSLRILESTDRNSASARLFLR